MNANEFAQLISLLRTDDETQGGWRNDDAWETLHRLISTARVIAGDPCYGSALGMDDLEDDSGDVDEDSEDYSGDYSEGRTMAGMAGGNQGLADYDGLELNHEDDPDEEW